jgi:UDP-N-acetylmuramate--alanine ligase
MSRVAPITDLPAAETLGRVHLMGIGGAGMSGLARLLSARGLAVSGCDAHESPVLATLAGLGVDVAVGHDPAHVLTVDTVVVSSAIRPENPELAQARLTGCTILPRAAALAALMAGRRAVAVAGTHGKTTTTSMLTVALQACGLDPSYAIGGDLDRPGSNAHSGTGDLFVAEADESDGSFLQLAPEVAVVTNVEPDHLDTYGDLAAVRSAFAEFVTRTTAGGTVVLGADDEGAASLSGVASRHGLQVRSFGRGEASDVRIDRLELVGAGSRFELTVDGRVAGPVRLQVPGDYNARNAAAAITAGLALGLPFDDLARGLATFTGARRRFELKGISAGGVRVYDDYAHHPTEVQAVLGAARHVAGSNRVIAVFQPHLYSRTQNFAREFGAALAAADEVVVMAIYAAREDPMPGVSAALVAEAVDLPADRVHYEPSWPAVVPLVAARSRPGDVVLTIGAGDVTRLGPELLEQLRQGDDSRGD